MSPRPYDVSRRQAATGETRDKILSAARALLADEAEGLEFSIDAIARKAGVARMTVYYQFESKGGLLEALFDQLASRALVERMVAAFKQDEPLAALSLFIRAFAGFWESERLPVRRLSGLMELDADIGQGMRARSERRRNGAKEIMRRLAGKYGRPAHQHIDDAVDVLFTLTSFEVFDSLATGSRTPDQAAALIETIVKATVGLETGGEPGARV